jgi:hypothetical protein
MKKLLLLFLLTTVLVSFTFAVDGVGNVTAKVQADMSNVTKDYRGLVITPSLGYSNSFDALSLSATVKLPIGIKPLDGGDTKVGIQLDTLKIGYSLAAGPGTLGFYLENYDDYLFEDGSDLNGNLTIPGISYAIPVGSGVLTPEAGLNLVYAKDFLVEHCFFKIDYALDAGLDINLKAKYGIDAGKYMETEFEISYQFAPAKLGLYFDFLGSEFKGFEIKPFGELALTNAISIGLEVPINNVNGTGDSTLGIGIWGSYSF